MEAKSNKFGKELKIKNPQEFSKIFIKNNSFYKSGIIMLTAKNDLKKPRLGVSIPKKHIQLSVKRNRIKRIVKESFRLNYKNLSASDIIIISSRKMNYMSADKISQTLSKLWLKIEK